MKGAADGPEAGNRTTKKKTHNSLFSALSLSDQALHLVP